MNRGARLARSAGVVSGATLVSRVFGFIRDMIVANAFGASMSADAFYVAFGIPNLLRNFFAEGALSAAFIPVFTRERTNRGDEAARRLSGALMVSLALILAVVTLLGVLAAPYVVRILVPGFTGNPSKYALTVTLTRIMFPFIFFIGLAAISAGILNIVGHFLTPALTPVFFNLSMIACALWLAPSLDKPVAGLAWGVVIGGAAQWVVQLKPLHTRRQIPRWRWEPLHPGSRRVAGLMVPALFGFSIAQISTLVDRFLASFLAEGSISFLYYANRLLQFPLGVFGIALSIAFFPALASHAARKEEGALVETLGEGLRLILFVCLPSAVGLAILASPIIQVLFERGAFTATDTAMTARAVIAYAAGLVAYAGVKIIVSAFYSLQDTRTPVRIAAWVLMANVALNLLLMIPLKHAGLALASALCAYLNVGLLLRSLRRRLGPLRGRAILGSLLRILPPTGVLAAVVYGVNRMIYVPSGSLAGRAGALAACLVAGASVYLLTARAMGCPELSILRESLRGREVKEPLPSLDLNPP
ncbi:MAG: murein biosynthesis integral membrane protein MurJ [Nitrospinota bacterium]